MDEYWNISKDSFHAGQQDKIMNNSAFVMDAHHHSTILNRTVEQAYIRENTPRPPDEEEEYPKIPREYGIMPLSTIVIFVYFLILPIGLILLYSIWQCFQNCLTSVLEDDNKDPFDNSLPSIVSDDDDEENNVFFRVTRTAPILTKLPHDYVFPTYTENVEATDVHSDVFGSSYGSLVSLPGLFFLCSWFTKKRTTHNAGIAYSMPMKSTRPIHVSRRASQFQQDKKYAKSTIELY